MWRATRPMRPTMSVPLFSHAATVPDAASAFDPACDFALVSARSALVAHGVRARLDPVPAPHAAKALAAFFARETGGPDLVVGALPFDRETPGHFHQPRDLWRGERGRLSAPAGEAHMAGAGADVVAIPAAGEYAAAVAAALRVLADPASELRKIVLSRSLAVRRAGGFPVAAIIERLSRDRGVTTYSLPLPDRLIIGATPELLVAKTGQAVLSHPLAGSTPRLQEAVADYDAAQALLNSDKNRREHAAVVEAILDVLAPYCRTLPVPGEPRLAHTASLWHLGTEICGTLKDGDVSSLELACALHPTPAVCGLPRAPAADLIASLEPFDRGFYAGALGWCDRAGDGQWYVSIRCAEIIGEEARLFAGAGIVPGSDPQEEVVETSTKFMALLGALGVEEPGRH